MSAEAMILDWFCPCGASGAAVALKPEEVSLRISLSHRYASARVKRKDRRQCSGDRLRYSVRSPAPLPEKAGAAAFAFIQPQSREGAEMSDHPVRGLHPEGAYWQGPSETQEAGPRQRSIEQLRGVVSMLAHFIWYKRTRPGEHLWSIPADKERDWDCILTDAIDELEQLRASRLTGEASAAAQDEKPTRSMRPVSRHTVDCGCETCASPVPAPAQEVCICAAIRLLNGEVWRGHRHDDAIRVAGRAPDVTNSQIINAEQGFITSLNRFVGREEAARLQRAAGILSAQTMQPVSDLLFSEDLYLRDWRSAPTGEAASPAQTPTSTSSAAAQPPS